MKIFRIIYKNKEYFVKAQDSISAVEKVKGRVAIFDAEVGSRTKVFLHQHAGLSYGQIENLGKKGAAKKVAEIKEKQGGQLSMPSPPPEEVSKKLRSLENSAKESSEDYQKEQQQKLQKEKEYEDKLTTINTDYGTITFEQKKELVDLEEQLEKLEASYEDKWDDNDYAYSKEKSDYGKEHNRLSNRIQEIKSSDGLSTKEIRGAIIKINSQIKECEKALNDNRVIGTELKMAKTTLKEAKVKRKYYNNMLKAIENYKEE